jgi:hypothetical protein
LSVGDILPVSGWRLKKVDYAGWMAEADARKVSSYTTSVRHQSSIVYNTLIKAAFGSGKKIMLTKFHVNQVKQVHYYDLLFSLNANFITYTY